MKIRSAAVAALATLASVGLAGGDAKALDLTLTANLNFCADVTLDQCKVAFAGSVFALSSTLDGLHKIDCCPAILKAATKLEPWAANVTQQLPPSTRVPEGAFDADVILAAREPKVQPGIALPDFRSYKSIREWLMTVRRTPLGLALTDTRFAGYEANGNAIDSCEEYVYEKYFDVSKYEDAIARLNPDDWRGQFDVAFGAAATPSSIGTRRVGDSSVRARDGASMGSLYDGTASSKNRFLQPANYPGPSYAGNSTWWLLTSYLLPAAGTLYGQEATRLQAIATKIGSRTGDRVVRNLAWHRDSSAAVAALPRRVPAYDSDGNAVPRYLDAELDELDALQDRWLDGIGDLKACMAKATIGYYQDRYTEYGTIAVPAQSQSMANFELMGCTAIVRELRTILKKADDFGCFEPGVTACDWSPRFFARDLKGRLTLRQENDYKACITRLDRTSDLDCSSPAAGCVSYQNYPGKSVAAFCDTGRGEGFLLSPKGAINPARSTQQGCYEVPGAVWYSPAVVTTTSTAVRSSVGAGNRVATRGDFEAMLTEIDRYDQASAQRELERAAAAVRVPDLVDPRTGALRRPGETRGGGDTFGDPAYFAVSYDWSTSWGLENLEKKVCNVHSMFQGSLNATASVAGMDKKILEANARFGITGTASVKILGNAVDINGGAAGSDLSYGVHAAGEIFNLTYTPRELHEEFGKEIPFSIGPIPLSLELGIAGRAGLDLGVSAWLRGADVEDCDNNGLGATLSGSIRPWVKVDAFAELALDAVIAEAGVRGDVTLIDVSIPTTGSIDIGTRANAQALADVRLSANLSSQIDIRALDGSMSAYVELGISPFSERWSKRLFGWDGYQKTIGLFSSRYSLPIATLADLVSKHVIP